MSGLCCSALGSVLLSNLVFVLPDLLLYFDAFSCHYDTSIPVHVVFVYAFCVSFISTFQG